MVHTEGSGNNYSNQYRWIEDRPESEAVYIVSSSNQHWGIAEAKQHNQNKEIEWFHVVGKSVLVGMDEELQQECHRGWN